MASARPVECERNFVVFEEEDEANEMFVVRSGRVAVGRRSIDGRESLVALMEQGDLFGEMSLFDEGTRSASARALEHSRILGIPYGVVREALDDRPELLWQVVRLLAERLRYTDSALADAVFLDVTGRTAKRLLELAGDADDFQLPITQEELAGLVGASRERVNKSIAAFIRLGLDRAAGPALPDRGPGSPGPAGQVGRAGGRGAGGGAPAGGRPARAGGRRCGSAHRRARAGPPAAGPQTSKLRGAPPTRHEAWTKTCPPGPAAAHTSPQHVSPTANCGQKSPPTSAPPPGSVAPAPAGPDRRCPRGPASAGEAGPSRPSSPAGRRAGGVAQL